MDADLKRASSLAQSGRFGEAAQIYRKLLASSPDQPEATHFLGVCLLRTGRRDEGLALLERSIRLAPRNAMYRQNFGLTLAEAGDFPRAGKEFDELLARHGHAEHEESDASPRAARS